MSPKKTVDENVLDELKVKQRLFDEANQTRLDNIEKALVESNKTQLRIFQQLEEVKLGLSGWTSKCLECNNKIMDIVMPIQRKIQEEEKMEESRGWWGRTIDKVKQSAYLIWIGIWITTMLLGTFEKISSDNNGQKIAKHDTQIQKLQNTLDKVVEKFSDLNNAAPNN